MKYIGFLKYTRFVKRILVKMEEKENACAVVDCKQQLLAVRDALEILGGKWKTPIIWVLSQNKKMRFKELQRQVTGITSKMLSKELKDLEENLIVTRTVMDTRPITVNYELTSYGSSTISVIKELYHWGISHRKKVIEG